MNHSRAIRLHGCGITTVLMTASLTVPAFIPFKSATALPVISTSARTRSSCKRRPMISTPTHVLYAPSYMSGSSVHADSAPQRGPSQQTAGKGPYSSPRRSDPADPALRILGRRGRGAAWRVSCMRCNPIRPRRLHIPMQRWVSIVP